MEFTELQIKNMENDVFETADMFTPSAPMVKYKKVLYCNKCKFSFLNKNQECCPRCKSYDLDERTVKEEEPPYK